MILPDIASDLRKLVGDRVASSAFERWFYTQDLLHLPRPVKALFKTMPYVIVKPADAGHVSAVVGYCNKRHIPVVVRGGGSSGLFASVPKRGGVVMDMMALDDVLDINPQELTVTARAGLTWWEMEKRLNREGLCLRSYPSSARSATLGGWVMTGGLGIGSLKYGPVFDQVTSLEIVHADGSVREYDVGFGLARFFETEGTLGIVTRLTIKVRRIPQHTAHHLAYFRSIHDLFQAAARLASREPVPFSMEMFDSQYMTLLKEAGYPSLEHARDSGALLITYDGLKEDVAAGGRYLGGVLHECDGIECDGAEEHWRERFDMLRIRRAAPSLVPSSVYVPLQRAGRFYDGLRRLRKRPLGLVGHVVSPTHCNLMPMMVTDETHPVEYAFSLHTPSEISNLALSLGGKPGGGVGVWNAPYRAEVLGRSRLSRVRMLKRTHDPARILNPGMWLYPHPFFTPAVYRPAMTAASVIDALLPSPKKMAQRAGFEAELAACVQCGYCMNYCPTRLEWLSTTPRGRILATRELFLQKPQRQKEFAPEYVTRLFQCTACGRCGVDCSTDIRSRAMWLGVRKHLAANGLVPDSLKELGNLITEHHNIAARPNDSRAAWTGRLKLPYDLKAKRTAPVVYFTGCVTSFFPMVQPTARAFVQLMDAAGVDFTIAGGDEWCCGFPLLVAGDTEGTAITFRHNLERMKDMGAQTIVTACPGCYKVWKEEYEDVIGEKHPFTVLHSTEFITRLLEQKKLAPKALESTVTYHDPCDLGRNAGIYDEPRYILGRIPGLNLVEMENNRQYCTCCGSGGDLLASNKDLSLAIAGRKVREILSTGASTAVTACPSCVRAIHMAKINEKVKLDVLDITELLWKAVGS